MATIQQPKTKQRNYSMFRRIPRKFLILFGLSVLAFELLSSESQGLFLLPSTQGDRKAVLTQDEFPQPDGIVVAYAVSITHCHEDDFVADAAAVLAHSIHLQSSRVTDETNNGMPKSRYDYQMYAFVHPDAKNCTASLEKLGYDVLVRDTPIQVSDIRNSELRHDVATQGCCQEKEFLKLYSLTLTEHPIVVHLDLDVIVLQNLDGLFDAMMLPDTIHYEYNYKLPEDVSTTSLRQQEQQQKYPSILKNIPDAMWATRKSIPITSYFTRDYNMAKQMHETPPNRVGMQGGFWVVQPNLQVFDDFIEVILDGHNYTSEWGWGGTNLPKASYYGGAQIQGLVSYYYGFIRQGISVELNKCTYNNMVDRPRAACIEAGMTDTQCEDCRRTPIERVRTFHLTLCKKPWWCPTWIEEPLCSQFHFEWHRIRADLEHQLGIAASAGLSTSAIQSLVNTSDMKQVLGAFPNHCSRMGSKGYKHIPFPFYSDEEFQKQQQQQQQQQPQSAEVPSPESNHDYNVGMASQQIQANGPLTTTADSGATGWGVVEPNNDQAVTTNNMGQQGQGLPGTNSYQNGFSSIPQYQQGDANSFNGWVPPHQQNGLLNAPNANFMGNNGWPSAQQSQIFGNNQQVPYGQQGYYDGGVVQNQQIESPSSAYDDGWIP